MKLYIANCTRQNWVVHYRLDFTKDGELDPRRQNQPAKQMTIAPGRQVLIPGADHISQIDDVVNQLQRYGMVGVKDVPGLKTTVKKFDPSSLAITPLVFNVDAPVPANVFQMVQDVNARIQTGQGQERRRRAAVAVNEIVQHKVESEFMAAGFDEKPSDKVDVAFEQLEQSEAGEKMIAEGYKVDKSAPTTTPPKKNGRRRAA